MSKITSTGVVLGVVADTPTTIDDDATTGFPSLTYVTVGEVVDLPPYGPTVQVVESNPLATGITEKFKGFKNYGSISIGLEVDFDDAGQDIMSAATDGAEENTRHSFKVTYSDGTVEYFAGKSFSFVRGPGSANSMVAATSQVEIETPVVRVAAPD